MLKTYKIIFSGSTRFVLLARTRCLMMTNGTVLIANPMVVHRQLAGITTLPKPFDATETELPIT
jgi:hypothetical protein